MFIIPPADYGFDFYLDFYRDPDLFLSALNVGDPSLPFFSDYLSSSYAKSFFFIWYFLFVLYLGDPFP